MLALTLCSRVMLRIFQANTWDEAPNKEGFIYFR